MDLQGKPAFQEADCTTCAKYQDGKCSECGKDIPPYFSPSGANSAVPMGAGFQAPTPHHWHLKSVQGIQGYSAVNPTLCRECFYMQYVAAFPDRKLDMDELPREITYS